MIRDTVPADLGAIVRLNTEAEHFLSPLGLERLEALHCGCAYHRVATVDGRVAARLHQKFGFGEVGRQVTGDAAKTVSLQAVLL